MMESRNDGQTPPISGPGPEEDTGLSGSVPEVEGYEIAGPLGRGGMGTVWSAVQLSTRREVALKLLGKGLPGSEKDRARFEREVELTARLHHPNIAQVFDSGVHRGVYYYAMELIEGAPLDKHVEDQQLTQRQTLELMRTVCQAVQHAHERGVIHRDLKPSNILVTEDGQPHILDFGLAKTFLEGDWVLAETTYGEAAGTPAYMSPEQAAGKLDQIDIRTDVYALGVILFRLLTDKPPHDLSGSRYEVLRRIAEEEVRRPRELTKDVDRELEALLLKALARDPKDRYPSAGALAQDIENYLTGEPLTARPPSTAYFLRKRISKYRGRVAVAASFLAALMGVAVYAYVRVSDERTKALAARDKLQRELDKATAVYNFLGDFLTLPWPLPHNDRRALDKAAERIEIAYSARPELKAVAHKTLGQLYLFLGYLDGAGEQFLQALDFFGDEFGDAHPDTIESMGLLRVVLWQSGRLDDHEALVRRLVKAQAVYHGCQHIDTLSSMEWLQWALKRKGCLTRGELHELEPLSEDIVELARQLRGDEDPVTLRSMNFLADIHWRRGELHQVERLNRQILGIREKAYGKKDPWTLWAMSNLAEVLLRREEVKEAKALLKAEFEIRNRLQNLPEDIWMPLSENEVLAYDAFDVKLTLDWEILNPDPSHFSLTKHPGTLTITTQDGEFGGSNTPYENLFVIDCPASEGGDFQVTACLSFQPVASWNQAGLICFNGEENFVRLCYEYSHLLPGRIFSVDIRIGRRYNWIEFPVDEQFEKVWLRVTKRGNRWAFSASLDGETFFSIRYPLRDMTGLFQGAVAWGDGSVRRIGLYALNSTETQAPEIDASFDFFEIKSLGPEAEAAGEAASSREKDSDDETA